MRFHIGDFIDVAIFTRRKEVHPAAERPRGGVRIGDRDRDVDRSRAPRRPRDPRELERLDRELERRERELARRERELARA